MTFNSPGLGILNHGHLTRLKWHRLRRSLQDPPFSAEVIAAGLSVGASMELDLRVRSDGGFVALHDAELQGETTGHGKIRNATASDIRSLRLVNGGHSPLLSEDLAVMLQSPAPGALLQLDIKDELSTIGETGLDHLTHCLAGPLPCVIVSARDLDLLVAVREKLPDLARGIDPSRRLAEAYAATGWTAVERRLLEEITGPSDPSTVYVYWPLLLEASRAGLDLVALCHAAGKLVDAWTFNPANPSNGLTDEEASNFSALAALKVDQVTTDEACALERAWIESSPR